jgi:hypothetical protein
VAVTRAYLPSQLPAALRKQAALLRGAVVKGLRRAAQRGLVEIDRRITNAKPYPPIHTGHYRRAWKVTQIPKGAILGNDAPYAPVIELGRRPGATAPPLAPILDWVFKKFRRERKWKARHSGKRAELKELQQHAEMRQIAFAIQQKIKKRGMAPRHIMTGAQRRLGGLAEQEIARACTEAEREA